MKGSSRSSFYISDTEHTSPLHSTSSMASSKNEWDPSTKYPATKTSATIERYGSEKNGEEKVPDPFSWLEEDSSSSDRKKFIASENGLARKFLDSNPHRSILKEKIAASLGIESVSDLSVT